MTRLPLIALLLLAPVADAVAAPPTAAPPTAAPAPVRVIEIRVDAGYQPDRIVVTEGEVVQLRFLRTAYGGCTREVVFPTLGARHELPTNTPVTVDLGAPKAGEIPFHCGMEMFHATLVVRPRDGAL